MKRLAAFLLIGTWQTPWLAFADSANARWQAWLDVPETAAVVTAASRFHKRLPDYILIQDVHSHAEAQTRIATLLQKGWAEWGVSTTYIEGAFCAIDSDEIMKTDTPSGAELALREIPATKAHPFQLIGMESPELYRENVAAYADVMEGRDAALMELSAYDSSGVAALTKLLNLRVTPAERAQAMSKVSSFRLSPDADKTIKAAERFYEVADKRSLVFLANVEQDHAGGPHVLVMGGFHTRLVCDQLRRQGKSFVVLSPTLQQPADSTLYAAKMRATIQAVVSARPPLLQTR
jgi:hypothetical protein